jgi:uncharacterized protein (TIGR03435 family)
MRLAAVLSILCSLAPAQTPRLAFEVVSLKPTSETPAELFTAGKELIKLDDSRVILRAVNLLGLVQLANGQQRYGMPDDQVEGPSWMDDVRFDVVAKLPAGATKAQLPAMLWTMLADRFKMTAHEEEKVRPVFFLVMGKAPLKLNKTAGGKPIPCTGSFHRVCQNVTMEDFADILSRGRSLAAHLPVGEAAIMVDRPVIDHTGLKGAYDFTMEHGYPGETRHQKSADPANIVPIKDAVKDLGLALESGKAPHKVLVIDHIERAPTEN